MIKEGDFILIRLSRLQQLDIFISISFEIRYFLRTQYYLLGWNAFTNNLGLVVCKRFDATMNCSLPSLNKINVGVIRVSFKVHKGPYSCIERLQNIQEWLINIDGALGKEIEPFDCFFFNGNRKTTLGQYHLDA